MSKWKNKLRSYLKTPGFFIAMILVMLSALITFSVLLFLIAYILIKGLPHLSADLFALKYTSENGSLMPALINTVFMTFLSLIVAVPLGIFSLYFWWNIQEKEINLWTLSALQQKHCPVFRLSYTVCSVCCFLYPL